MISRELHTLHNWATDMAQDRRRPPAETALWNRIVRLVSDYATEPDTPPQDGPDLFEATP